MSGQGSPFDTPNFENITAEKLSRYFAVAQSCLERLRQRYPYEVMARRWEDAQQAWHADPANPSTCPPYPFTPQVVEDFYAKCDIICNSFGPNANDTNELIRTFFATNNGALFISNEMLEAHNHPLSAKITKEAGEIAVKTLLAPERIRALQVGRSTALSSRVDLGDIISYHSTGSDAIRTIRIKNHGSSAIKGEFFVVTPIIDEEHDANQRDVEVPVDQMETYLQRRVYPH